MIGKMTKEEFDAKMAVGLPRQKQVMESSQKNSFIHWKKK